MSVSMSRCSMRLSPHDAEAWDYLITIELCADDHAGTVVNGDACARLLGDLRVIGMRSNLVFADDTRPVVLAGEHL